MYHADIPVRFGDVDPAGVVYYPRFFHYYHSAFERFFGDCHGVDYATWIQERHVGFPTRHVEADFASPLRYGETARVRVSIARLGESSLDFRFDVTTVEGRAVGWALATKICVDMRRFESQPIPDELRSVFERYPSDASTSDESTP